MYEEPWYLRSTVENALSHTADDTIVVLHLNRDTVYPSPLDNSSDFEWLWSQPRVEVNCARWPVHRWSGEILHSQLSNLQWARCRGMRPRHVVFQASNMWWVRRGMEEHVRATGSSVPLVASDEACARLSQGGNGHGSYEACTRLAPVGEGRASQAAVGSRTVDPCYVPPFPGMRYLVQRKHEGSYYSAEDAYRMLDYLEAGLRSPDLAAERAKATEDARCRSGGRRSLLQPDLWSTEWPLEEVFLQTWVANFGRANGTGDVLHKELKWKRRPWSCPEIAPALTVRGIYAAKFHDLRDVDPIAARHRTLLSTCRIPSADGGRA